MYNNYKNMDRRNRKYYLARFICYDYWMMTIGKINTVKIHTKPEGVIISCDVKYSQYVELELNKATYKNSYYYTWIEI